MISEKLAREKEVVIDNFEEGMELINTDFLVQRIKADLKELEMDEDGQLSWGSSTFPATDWTFESLCKQLKIPLSFARSISPDLFFLNFNKQFVFSVNCGAYSFLRPQH